LFGSFKKRVPNKLSAFSKMQLVGASAKKCRMELGRNKNRRHV
jgi:hypothetical protein